MPLTLVVNDGAVQRSKVKSVKVMDGSTVIAEYSGAGFADGQHTLTVNGEPLNFHRLFGDVNGDAQIESGDLISFSETYMLSEGDPQFNPLFDFDEDGTVGTKDFIEFVNRYFTSV